MTRRAAPEFLVLAKTEMLEGVNRWANIFERPWKMLWLMKSSEQPMRTRWGMFTNRPSQALTIVRV